MCTEEDEAVKKKKSKYRNLNESENSYLLLVAYWPLYLSKNI